MLQLVQSGSGARRPLVLAYFIADHQALLAGLPAEACVLTDVDNPAGRFVQAPGHGGVDPLDVVVTFARQHASAFDPSAVVLVGWSAGCEAVREQLRAGAAPDVVVCLDGVAGSVPPTVAQIAPWRTLIEHARAGVACFLLTHTAMEYTERLPLAQRFESTTHMAKTLTGTEGNTPPIEGEISPVEGSLYVIAYPSGDIDAAAHDRQQNVVLPDLLRRVVSPWLEAREPASPSEPPTRRLPITVPPPSGPGAPTPVSLTPVTTRELSKGCVGPDVIAWRRWLDVRAFLGLGAVQASGEFDDAVVVATRRMQNTVGLVIDGVLGDHTRAQAAAWPAPAAKGDDGGPTWTDTYLPLGARAVRWALQWAGREDLERLGPNSSPEITEWLEPAIRRATGGPLGITMGEWCAAFFCASAAAVAGQGEELPHNYRAAGVELIADAKERGTWREAALIRSGTWQPSQGDGCLLKKGGSDWETHTCRVVALSPEGLWTVGGNEENTVRLTHRTFADADLLGFIAYG